ncbi:hypothetical protein CYMTET_13131 [Cymbomonas tetramitiformis]|uniref:Uncharacterized protein n=1 Tax=Cymbomonas tetramitiformis TaxID=36881 RepID=A0AAE0GJB2_9CHLO|nr:hypothetical protein CYMTET_13131 [Cymbomonas tetramitiformis]
MEHTEGACKEMEWNSSSDPNSHVNALPTEDTTLDPSYLIALIRRLMPSEAQTALLTTEPTASKEAKSEEEEDDKVTAGCILWDITTIAAQAEFLGNNLLPQVALCNLQNSPSERLQEVMLGIMANLSVQPSGAAKLAEVEFRQEILSVFHDSQSPPVLTEVLRLFRMACSSTCTAAALAWARDLLQAVHLQRVGWIIANSLSSGIVERAADVISALATKQREMAVPELVYQAGLLTQLTDGLQTHTQAAASAHDNMEGEGESMAAVDGLLRALEVGTTVLTQATLVT